MFRWLKKRQLLPSLISEAVNTLNEVRTLPEATQREIAANVVSDIMFATRQIESTPGHSPERDQVIRDQISHAKAARHRALSKGAKDWADPEYAGAAIIESWLMANSGALGRKAFDEITGIVNRWLHSVIRDSDFEETASST